MARRSAWRKECPGVVRERQTRCPRIFLLRESGPIAFTLQEERRVVRVRLGDPHECSCSTFRKERELCSHICWTLIRKFHLSAEDPLSYQLGLVPLELEALIKGTYNRNSTTPAQKSKESPTAPVPSRPISPLDMCPICLENLIKSRRPVIRCKYGCGRPVHVSCISVLAKFHKQESIVLRCPMCRGEFCTLQQLYKLSVRRRYVRLPPPELHPCTCCSCLMCPVPGALYRCLQCPLVILCAPCAASTVLHHQHALAVKQTPQDRWRRVRQKSTTSSEIVLPAMRVQQCTACPVRPTPIRSLPQDVHSNSWLQERRKKPLVPQLGLGSALHVKGLSLSDRRDHQKRKSPIPDAASCKYTTSITTKMSRRAPGSTLSITSLTFPEHLTRTPALRERKQSGCERRWTRSAGRNKLFTEPPQLTCSRVELRPRDNRSRLVVFNCHRNPSSYSDVFHSRIGIPMYSSVSETLAQMFAYSAVSQKH